MPLFVGGVKGFEGDRAEAAEGRMASTAVVEHQSLAGHSFNQRKQSHLSQQPPTITAAGVPQTGIPMRAVVLRLKRIWSRCASPETGHRGMT